MINYNEEYQNSWALCIGINNYEKCSPLEYAVHDSKEVSQILVDKYNFNKERVFELYDKEATRANIFKKYMSFSNIVEPDDRIIFFFAGHGHTLLGTRGEIGFLVPYDGDTNDVSSLLRWDDLTRNSELISAKHMFFILDACFSGLALTRALPRGSMRFMNDMLKRYSRQVIAAGKANQSVSDSGGPIPEHSIFTGYLINGLNGEAEGTDNIITANGLMSYLYDKVSKDYHSFQTPHFGYFDGDGDCILKYKANERDLDNEGIVEDKLFEVPLSSDKENNISELGFIDKIKEYISDQRYIIKLDDLLTAHTRVLISQITSKNFTLDEHNISEEKIKERLFKYEKTSESIRTLLISISNWGNQQQKSLQHKVISRISDHLTYTGGVRWWIALRWYPLILFMYEIGIPYLINADYKSLYKLFNLEVTPFDYNKDTHSFLLSYSAAISEINYTNIFKSIKEHERHYVPLNEYLFRTLQPLLEDVLFLGKSYEYYFDRLEILIGLICADIHGNSKSSHYWGPLGRYSWKYSGRFGENNPFSKLKNEAFEQRESWGIIQAGFFNSSFERFEKTINAFEENLNKLNWY